ncbi:LOW QUALITY PROTEIN: hypothetical protein Cgig2_004346 [Carnegiea gigantea]|uniref:Uncharacterized protein n=1 Tax=Carnegiea gigantea TaxID=171969 RepID=A0A9Q1JZ77_9CARY|nr:LOW QUALITY PROTEIN: hypothetical protein Cgig2_004346 [Carnegiea gigantea]
MVDALKNFMSTMTDTIMQQVTEQVKKVVETTSSARHLPHFDYVPTTETTDHVEKTVTVHWGGCLIEPSPEPATVGKVNHGLDVGRDVLPMNHLVRGAGPNLKTSREIEGRGSFERNVSPRAPNLKMKNAPLRYWPPLSGDTWNIALGLPERLNFGERSKFSWLNRGADTVPTVGSHFTSPHNNPLVVERKVASAIIRSILIDTGSLVDISTWECLKKLKCEKKSFIYYNTILGFEGQEVNLTGIICLPLCFWDKNKARNVEVDFLVVDVPMTYNNSPGHLHKVKAIIASYLLQFQFEVDNGGIGKLQGD